MSIIHRLCMPNRVHMTPLLSTASPNSHKLFIIQLAATSSQQQPPQAILQLFQVQLLWLLRLMVSYPDPLNNHLMSTALHLASGVVRCNMHSMHHHQQQLIIRHSHRLVSLTQVSFFFSFFFWGGGESPFGEIFKNPFLWKVIRHSYSSYWQRLRSIWELYIDIQSLSVYSSIH